MLFFSTNAKINFPIYFARKYYIKRIYLIIIYNILGNDEQTKKKILRSF